MTDYTEIDELEGTMGLIAPDGTAPYSQLSEEERRRYAFIWPDIPEGEE